MLFNLAGSEHRENSCEWQRFELEAMPHLASLFRIAMWLTRNQTDAEDLVQETLTEALGSFHRFTAGTNCRAWLIAIMYHHQSKKRRAASHLHLVSDYDERIAESIPFEPSTPQGLTDEEVLLELKRLPRSFQEVVILADVEGLTYKEIAAATNVPVGTVMSRISRGRKLLRLGLAGYARAHGFGRAG